MTLTATFTRTNTYTEARLRAVMPEVGADFYSLAAAGLIGMDAAQKWTEELTFILQHQAAKGFQIQLKRTGSDPIAIDYRVSSDGTVRESSMGGGIDYFALPVETRASLFVDLNYQARAIDTVRLYIAQRGWGTDGQGVQGQAAPDRTYSKDGYGIVRAKIGTWP
ncbi:MAG: hypothetical protein ACREFQ_17410 [Stellaceae bacterium]